MLLADGFGSNLCLLVNENINDYDVELGIQPPEGVELVQTNGLYPPIFLPNSVSHTVKVLGT